MTTTRRLLSLAFLSLSLCACSTARMFSPEYSKRYVLAQDTIAGDCPIFIRGTLPSLLGGPTVVTCFRHDYGGRPDNSIMLKKGSAVRIKRFVKGYDVNFAYTIAELEVTDPDSGRAQSVYSQDWSRHRDQLMVEVQQ